MPTACHFRFAARRRTALACASLLVLAGATLPTAAALARGTAAAPAPGSAAFDIAAGPLDEALNQAAAQAGIALSFDPALVNGRRSPALRAHMAPAEALARLLAGTGLVAEPRGPAAFVVLRASALTAAGDGSAAAGAPGTVSTGLLSVAGAAGQGDASGSSDDAPANAFETYAIPRAVHHISREQILRVPYSRVGDVLDGVPGVAAANSANASGIALNLRGIQGMGRVRLLVDDAEQSVSTYRGYAGNREDTFIDPDLIGSIDIRKGPQAGVDGVGAVGGIAKVHSLGAADIITDPTRNWGVTVKVMGGTNTNSGNLCLKNPRLSGYTQCIDRKAGVATAYWASDPDTTYKTNLGGSLPTLNGSVSVAAAWRPVPGWDLVAAYARRTSSNYDAGTAGASTWTGLGGELAGGEVFNTSTDSRTYMLKSKYRTGDHTVEASYIDYSSNAGYYAATTGFFTGSRWQYPLRKTGAQTLNLAYTWKPDSRWIDFHAVVWGSRVRGGQDYEGVAIASDMRGANLSNSALVPLPLGLLTLKVGGSYSWERTNFALNATPVVAGSTESGDLVHASGKKIGAFGRATWDATPWLSVNGGLQYMRVDQRDLDTRPAGGAGTTPDTHFRTLSPDLGLVIKPHEAVQFYATWSNAARAPALRESFMTDLSQPNPGLRPERLNAFEYGMNVSLRNVVGQGDKLGLKLSRFNNTFHDYIVRMSFWALGVNAWDQSSPYTFSNISKVQLKGVELSADYDSKLVFGNVAGTWYDTARYCYPSYTQDPSTWDYVAVPSACYDTPVSTDWGGTTQPRFEVKGTLGLHLAHQTATLGTRFRHATRSMAGGSLWGLPLGTDIWGAYTVFDLFGGAKINRYAKLDFSVENLFNRLYVPSYANAIEALPAPGRTGRLTLTLSL